MSDDPYLGSDAAYVLGALSPEERQRYEQHMRSCPACSAAVAELAGMPGLLARTTDDPDEPVPERVLPKLLARGARAERRRKWVTASGWLAFVAAGSALVAVLLVGPDRPSTPGVAQPMRAVSGADLAGQAVLTGVTWGTKVEVRCTYPEDGSGTDSYTLLVEDTSGVLHPVGSWLAVPGATASMAASTDVAAGDIKRLVVRDHAGKAVLELVR